jgi:hypothetical protein
MSAFREEQLMSTYFFPCLGILFIAAGLIVMVAFYIRRGVIPDKDEHGTSLSQFAG